MSFDIFYDGIPFLTRQPTAGYALSSDVAVTYALSGEVAGVTSSYVSQTYTISSYSATLALSSDVANVYALSSTVDALPTSSEIADVYTTSSYVADTYALSSTVDALPTSSEIAATYATSSQLATRVNGGTVYFYSDSGVVYNSSEVTHSMGGTPGSVVLTYGVPLGSGVETLWVSDLTNSSFWINIGTPHETSSTVYWMSYRSG